MVIGATVGGVLLCILAIIAGTLLLRRRRRRRDSTDVTFVVINPPSPVKDIEAPAAPQHEPWTTLPTSSVHHPRRKPVPEFIPSPVPRLQLPLPRTSFAAASGPTTDAAAPNPFGDDNPFDDPTVGSRVSTTSDVSVEDRPNLTARNRASGISLDDSDQPKPELTVRNRVSGLSEISLEDPILEEASEIETKPMASSRIPSGYGRAM